MRIRAVIQSRPGASFRFRAVSPLLLSLPLLLLTLMPAALAQAAANISGNVTDPSGAPVSGATVTVTNSETDAVRKVTTDASGSYRVLALSVGIYEVKVEKEGFEDALWSGIKLNVGEAKVENVQMVVSTAVQEVTVTASVQAPVVNTTTSPTSGLVSEKQIKDLPLNGRSYDQLITLNPGTVNFSSLRFHNTTTSNGYAFSVDGQKPYDNLILLNGIELTGASQLTVTPGSVSGNLLGVDAVREFNMVSGPYGAEYGKRPGAQVLVVTKSGTNQLHGSLYEFVRNSALDAKNYFDQPGSTPEYSRNQFGASMGGPLIKDKLFLFGNYEGFLQTGSETGTTVAFVPDLNARQGLLPCTGSGTLACNGLPLGTPIAVPGLNSQMLNYMSMWPTPTAAQSIGGGIAKIFVNPDQSIHEHFGTARLDYVIGPRDTFSGAYTIDSGTSQVPQPDPFFGSLLSLRSQTVSLQETHVFSPEMVNSVIAGFSRASFSNAPTSTVALDPSLDLVQGRGPGGISIGGGLTTTGGGSISGAGPNNAAGVWNHRNLYTFTDNLQLTKGRHQLSFGVWIQPLQDNENTASRQLGQVAFSNLTTFLQGTATSFQLVPLATELGWRSILGAWYVQDAVQLRRNLMVQAGLRYEFDTGWNEVHDRASQFLVDPATGILQTSPTVGGSVFTQNNAKKLLGPRVGLAWDVFGNGTTAVHAGYGIYYSMLDALAFQLNSNPPFNGAIQTTFTPLQPYDASSFDPNNPPANTKYAPQGVQQNAKVPTIEKWELGIEQRLNSTTTLRVAYIGSFGYHKLISLDPNTIMPVTCTQATCTDAGGVFPSGKPRPGTSVPLGTVYVPVGTRPNPNLGAGFYWYTEGNSSYNALQVEVAKRYSQNLQFRANYTWSKDLDINSAPTGAQANNEAQMVWDRFDLRKDWGPSAFNAAHVAHLTATYRLPFGHGQRWGVNATGARDKFASGWVLNMITTLETGFPITPLVGSNVSGTGDIRNPDRPVLNPNFQGPVVTGSPNGWFNTGGCPANCPFLLPTTGTFGLVQGSTFLPSMGRGALTGPGLVEMDVSLFKDTPITDRVNLQLRAECFNVLNHPNFGTPNLTVFSGGAVSSSAGQISYTATSSRQLQFGVKIIY